MSFPKYPAYKNSAVEWLGNIPTHWKVLELRRLMPEIESGVSVNALDNTPEDGIPSVLKTSCVYTGYFRPEERKEIIQEDIIRAACPVKSGRLIVSRMNTPDLVGAAGLSQESFNYVFLPDRLWQVKINNIDPKFAYYWTQTQVYRDQVKAACSGTSSSMQNLSQDKFLSFILPVPNNEEQKLIADFLDRETEKIDILIAEQQRLIELLQEKRQAVISHAVTKGLNPDAPMKDSGVEWLGQVPAHWSVGKLGYYTVTTTGSTPDRNNPSYWNGDIPWVKTGEVMYQDIYETEEKISDLALQQTSCSLLQPGTLLMALYGQGVTRGRVGMLAVEAACNQACAAITTDSRINPRFLELFLTKAYEHIRSLGNETTQQNLNLDFVRKLEIVVPPFAEQESIVDFLPEKLRAFESLVNDVKLEIDLLQERRSALISAAVTGQIDVRGLAEAVA
ncbi:restriction endonuclease subunit S [Synechococcus elongatus]|uniref:Restriction endonuclease subunit S n=1 Tax=Synechococcus elongatus PCC 11802 TaxID=2283154 RepID=A0AAT9JSM5_SYNEL|nr:restriction endonuclease subunit S [Synechococcus elongatus]QFZ92419.1 restriction endonuclease subunit S [Synechococcus elongatus PCC 11802]